MTYRFAGSIPAEEIRSSVEEHYEKSIVLSMKKFKLLTAHTAMKKDFTNLQNWLPLGSVRLGARKRLTITAGKMFALQTIMSRVFI
ncbi:MAG: hypothetical protein K2K57_10700 [Oscillospiraceae bacterium]|nr:hypothetical protein [Oscillospiraceae bacterium]